MIYICNRTKNLWQLKNSRFFIYIFLCVSTLSQNTFPTCVCVKLYLTIYHLYESITEMMALFLFSKENEKNVETCDISEMEKIRRKSNEKWNNLWNEQKNKDYHHLFYNLFKWKLKRELLHTRILWWKIEKAPSECWEFLNFHTSIVRVMHCNTVCILRKHLNTYSYLFSVRLYFNAH